MYCMLYEMRNVCVWFGELFHGSGNPSSPRAIIGRRVARNHGVSAKFEQALDHLQPLLLDGKH